MAGVPKIIILSEQLRGQSYVLTNDQYSIGRTEDRDICIPDPTISGHHATLTKLEDDTYAVRDEGSTNGSRLNGVKLEPGEVHPLANTDILQVGGVEMLFDCDTSKVSGSTTQTVINLEDTTGELPVEGMKNLGGELGRKKAGLHRENQKTMIIIWSVIGVLLLAAIVALVFFLVSLVG